MTVQRRSDLTDHPEDVLAVAELFSLGYAAREISAATGLSLRSVEDLRDAARAPQRALMFGGKLPGDRAVARRMRLWRELLLRAAYAPSPKAWRQLLEWRRSGETGPDTLLALSALFLPRDALTGLGSASRAIWLRVVRPLVQEAVVHDGPEVARRDWALRGDQLKRLVRHDPTRITPPAPLRWP